MGGRRVSRDVEGVSGYAPNRRAGPRRTCNTQTLKSTSTFAKVSDRDPDSGTLQNFGIK